ncbi:hypothetical protein NP493_1220g00049 [Ridgeia piscesae]|uniref:Extracellular globin n=1 Tax=Ridgeia piscesae TaxID=27915 RepID=A0AAD9KCH7_RIDPI|nr:hypothetical protein NP493_1220g00049 [Ridgeia piscesae]
MNSFIVAALLLCGATVALASEHCSYEDAEIVMKEWHQITSRGNSAPILMRAANVLFSGIFEKDPAARNLFTRVHVEDMHSGEFHAHTLRVMTGLSELINKLHSPAVLGSMLKHLAQQHALRDGVKHEHFHEFRDILYGSLGQLLDEYNPDAWKNCMFGILYGIAGNLP